MDKPKERLLALMVVDKERKDREKVVGAITQIDGEWIFYKRIIPKRDVLRIRGVWGIDIRIMEVLKREGIKTIHCYDDEANILYVATLDQFEEKSEVLGPHNIKSLVTTQAYLPMGEWKVTVKNYRTKFIGERELLN